MSAIRDIIDLAKELESRAKDRQDIDTLKQIHTHAFSVQSAQLEVMERDLRFMEENAKLKEQLAQLQSEQIRIEGGIEFRKGERTGNKWASFCPKCHMPAVFNSNNTDIPLGCSANCAWTSTVYRSDFDNILSTLDS